MFHNDFSPLKYILPFSAIFLKNQFGVTRRLVFNKRRVCANFTVSASLELIALWRLLLPSEENTHRAGRASIRATENWQCSQCLAGHSYCISWEAKPKVSGTKVSLKTSGPLSSSSSVEVTLLGWLPLCPRLQNNCNKMQHNMKI